MPIVTRLVWSEGNDYTCGRGCLTSSINKLSIVLRREKRIRKVSEELLQKPRNAVDIVVEALRVREVDLGRIYGFKLAKQFSHPNKAIYAYHCQTTTSNS